jgi:hypothetical protein
MLKEGDFIISQDDFNNGLCLSRISFLEENSNNVLATTYVATDDSDVYFIEISESIEVNTLKVVAIPSAAISYIKSSNEYR